MKDVVMATLPNNELNRLIKIELTVQTMIERGLIDEEQFNEIMNEEVFARAWPDDYDIKGIKYVVTDGNGNYVCFENDQKDNEVMTIGRADTKDCVKKFNTKKEAQEIANLLNLTVQEVK